MGMHFLFRTYADTKRGVGHVMRSLALAQALTQKGAVCSWVLDHNSPESLSLRNDWVGRIIRLPKKMPPKSEWRWLDDSLDLQSVDAVILDGYDFDSTYRQFIKEHLFLPLILFDDLNNSGLLYADLVINPVASAYDLGYENTASDATLCLGQNYRLLRSEFMAGQPISWDERQDLLLNFGGSDPQGLTIDFLKTLEASYSSLASLWPIHIVTGAAYAALDDLVSLINKTSLNIRHSHQCQNLAKLMRSSRLAISAAGGTQYELLHCCTPSILAVVADNQRLAAAVSATQKWCSVVQFPTAKELVEQAVKLWQDERQLFAMHQSARYQSQQNSDDMLVDKILTLVAKN